MKAFYDTIRGPVFGGRMSQTAVEGIETLLRATEGLEIGDRAYLLATSAHETAHTMQPITERGPREYFNKYEPGTKLGTGLGNTRPGDGWLFRGRGYVQITGRANYQRASQKVGRDLIARPDDALIPSVAAEILVRGCTEGWFTGKKLSDYGNYRDMRRVVNGMDRADDIARYAEVFEKALRTIPPPVVQEPLPAEPEEKEKPESLSWAAWFAAFVESLGRKG